MKFDSGWIGAVAAYKHYDVSSRVGIRNRCTVRVNLTAFSQRAFVRTDGLTETGLRLQAAHGMYAVMRMPYCVWVMRSCAWWLNARRLGSVGSPVGADRRKTAIAKKSVLMRGLC